jgi:hypothetical protein
VQNGGLPDAAMADQSDALAHVVLNPPQPLPQTGKNVFPVGENRPIHLFLNGVLAMHNVFSLL